MLELFTAFINSESLCCPGDRILVAVSGGIDSVVMARLFGKAGYAGVIAHCNFGLRGQESEADEQFVRSLASEMDWPVFVKQFDVDAEASSKGISIQMAARDLRYQWFESLAAQEDCIAVATAHNLDDSVETCLLNLTRGTGIRGMNGIPVRNGNIIRPLLFTTRREIRTYAEKHQIAYREDSSNRETRYSRNKIRHDVIPSLVQINPRFLETMSENMQRFSEAGQLLEKLVNETREELFMPGDQRIEIDAEALRILKPASTWMYELFSPFGFTRLQCEGIRQILDAPSGKRSLSPTHQLFKDRHKLILVPSETVAFNRYYLDRPENNSSLPFPMDVELLSREELGEIPADRETACLDYDLIDFPLTIRHWLHGDYFYPLGMDQMKKISDFFVDEKIPVPQKKRIWILASGKKVVWIMGYRIDHRFRVTEHTGRVLRLQIHGI